MIVGCRDNVFAQHTLIQIGHSACMITMKSDTGRANLRFNQDISDLLILLPNVEQQIEFEMFANQVDKSKFAVQKTLEQTQTLFDSLMQKYFG